MSNERYFPNEMPNSVAQVAAATRENEIKEGETRDSLLQLLCLPCPALAQKFQEAASVLLQMIVREAWDDATTLVEDFTLYTGALGTAFLLFKAYLVTNTHAHLHLCSSILHACEKASRASRNVTFICGRAGVCALGAVAAKHAHDEKSLDFYLMKFREIKLPKEIPNELLYGRAGYLWACLFLNKHIGNNTIPSSYASAVASDMIKEGRVLSSNSKSPSPLMYEWHGKKYWGAAHGLAGIIHVLMDVERNADELEDIKRTLEYMISNRFPTGNYPSSEGSENDRLVHWCHGAPGVVLTLVKAAEIFGSQEFEQAAVDAGEIVWNRGLLKRVGICHGVSGNAYAFLALYRLTGNVDFLHRAKAFSCFLLDKANALVSVGVMHGGDHPYSLFEGVAGMAHLFFDMVQPSDARFPAYEL